MAAMALLDELRAAGLTVSVHAGRLVVAPKERLTDEMRAAIRADRLQLLSDLEQEAGPLPEPTDQDRRRAQVLAALKSRPDIRFAYLAESNAAGEGIIALGIRNVGTGELVIPANRYDPMAVMRLLDDVAGGRA